MLRRFVDTKGYYLVDYDFKNIKDPASNRLRAKFYNEAHELLGRTLKLHTSTASVIFMNDRIMALKIRDIARQYGATAYARETRLIERLE
jgi:hypothetical protein